MTVGCSRQAMAERRQRHRATLEAELARIVDVLAGRDDVRRVIVFGSLAAGNTGEASDIDLAVIAESSVSFLDRYPEFYCCVHPRVPLDLFVYTPAEWDSMLESGGLPQRIASTGRVVYEAAD